MAVIYAVTGREDPGFPMAMKIPRLGGGEPGESVLGYEVERMVLAGLSGPHVPRFVAAGDIAERPYIVMEWVEGRSLSEWVGGGPVPADEVARLGTALANALHALHLQEAIHLDVKPSNVIIRPSGEAVLVDLGLAHHAHYPDLLAEEFRRPVGSAPYVSPEQVLGVRNEPRSDVFALGVVLYELATGRLPHGAPTTIRGLRRRLSRDPVPPRRLVPAVPEWLQEVILGCLEPTVGRRYATAAQVAFDLSHPDQVAITDRGRRLRRAGWVVRFRRWFRAAGYEEVPFARPSAHLSGAPIILAAVATAHTNEVRNEALRATVRRLLATEENSRLACVTVIRPAPEFAGLPAEESATGQRIQQLVLLRHWAESLRLADQRISFHVLESEVPAVAILEYARVNQVDHIVIGGQPPGAPLKGIISVAARVAVEATCTVTVVRPRGA
jgi:serine/threonine protein kinase